MIANLVKGRGFRGVLEYALQEHKGYMIDSNMAGENARELAKEFGAARALHPTVANPVHHVSLSLAPGEKLSDEQWREVTQRYLEGMGFTNNQHVSCRHTDTGHEHIHIIINRISVDGKLVSDSHDYKRQEQAMRKLECEYGLQEVQSSELSLRRAPTRGEIERSLRTGQPSTKILLQELVDKALKQKLEYNEFVKQLATEKVEVIPNIASTGRISGISFKHNEITMKGGDLGRGYTWGGLQKRGLTYEQSRDASPDGHERGRTIADPSRTIGGSGGDSHANTKDTGRIGGITRAANERYVEINRRYGSKIRRTGQELQMDKKSTYGDVQNMGLLPGEVGDTSRQGTERTGRNIELNPHTTRQNARNIASPGGPKQITAMDITAHDNSDSLSAMERVHAMADAGLRYTPKQSEHDLLQSRRVGETSAESHAERDKVADHEHRAKKIDQDIEL